MYEEAHYWYSYGRYLFMTIFNYSVIAFLSLNSALYLDDCNKVLVITGIH